VFGKNSFFHNKYTSSSVNDPIKNLRTQNIPRIDKKNEFLNMYGSLFLNKESPDKAKTLLKNLDGSIDLANSLKAYISDPGNSDVEKRLKKKLEEEISRINRAQIASFSHPNEKGAERYANVIVKRYFERIKNINLNNDISKFADVKGTNEIEKLKHIMSRYNLQTYNTNPLCASQLMLVDSIALEVKTARESQKEMYDDIFLNLGNGNRWQMNYPLHLESTVIKRTLYEHFKPSTKDLFTIDGLGVHLSSITQFTIEREKKAGKGASWKPTQITLYLNGINVFTTQFFSVLDRNGKIRLPYPTNVRY
jgi:hypothetical protein